MGVTADTVDVELKRGAVIGRRNMRPVGGGRRTIGDFNSLLAVNTGRIELGVPAPALQTDQEVLAEVRLVRGVRGTGPDRTFDHHLEIGRLEAGRIGLGPALDRKVEEHVVFRCYTAARRHLVEHERSLEEARIVLAAEVHGLTAKRIVEILRVGSRLGLTLRFLEVAEIVAVGIVTLVLLERIHRVKDAPVVDVVVHLADSSSGIPMEPREVV